MSSIKQILINAGQGPSAVLVEGLDIPKIVEVRQGPTGPAGPAGPAGPNTVSASTKTDLTGILTGDGANVSVTDATTGGNGPADEDLVAQYSTGGTFTYTNAIVGVRPFLGGSVTVIVPPTVSSFNINWPLANGNIALTSQQDGSIHADDLDFAGSTDIGAGLADADELLVSDGGGNTTRRKAALSRFWTYIKAKVEAAALTLSGAFTANGGAVFNEAGADVDFRVEGDSEPNLLFVNADNDRMGIGTNAPTVRATVIDNNASFTPLNIGGSSGVAAFADDINGVSGIRMGNMSAGALADFRFLLQDSTDHYFAFAQPSTGNTQAPIFGTARSTTDYIFSAGGTGRDMAIGPITANDLILGTNGAERVRIDSSGNVGVGDSTPASKLTVSGDIEATGSANGLILESPNGTRYRVTVDNSGVLSTASV